jgi:signal transduction histidine kinase
MPDGGTLAIRTGHEPDGRIITTVTDTGTGIAEPDLDRIFEPFFTKKEKGMGFGLAIVRRIIEDHHGTITCRSRLGEFTEFTIILPPAADQLPPSPTSETLA